jgi:Tfp pilus assembly protein PilX
LISSSPHPARTQSPVRVIGCRFPVPPPAANAFTEKQSLGEAIVSAAPSSEILVGMRHLSCLRSSLKVHGEDGLALVMALLIMGFLAIAVVAVTQMTTSTLSTSSISEAAQTAYALAEAGINNAESVLSNPSNTPTDPTLLQTPVTSRYNTGTATWSGSYNSSTSTWTVTSVGTVAAPVGGRSALSRQLVATVKVHSGTGVFNAATWNYAISAGTSNASTCDLNLTNSMQFQSPLYVEGNLCLYNSASVVKNVEPVNLTVGGKLAFQQGSTGSVGTSATPIDGAHIAGGCTADNTTAITNPTHPCTTADRVYAGVDDQNVPSIPIPTVDWAGAYATAIPGPHHPCTTVSGSPPVWDNDGVLDLTNYPNGSEYPVATPVNLTPVASYTCTATDGAGHTVGLIWNATAKTLWVGGEMYIDGSATVTTNTVYSGSGSLYLSGPFLIGNSTMFCPNATCTYSTWNSNTTMLMIVAHGDDGSGDSYAQSQSSKFEGSVYAEKTARIWDSSQYDGPILGHPLAIGNSVHIQPLPPVTSMPVGTPTTQNTHATVDPPVYNGP